MKENRKKVYDIKSSIYLLSKIYIFLSNKLTVNKLITQRPKKVYFTWDNIKLTHNITKGDTMYVILKWVSKQLLKCVWVCMTAFRVGNPMFIEDTMTKEDYVEILQENLEPNIMKLNLSRTGTFQSNNNPKHTTHIVKEWFLYHIPKQLKHPPLSPDSNPIKNLWSESKENRDNVKRNS